MNAQLAAGRVATWFVALLTAVSVEAASFDCTKAQTRAEKLICDNPELSKLDEELASAYGRAIKNKYAATSVRQSQRTWLQYRDESSESEHLTRIYQQRIAYLTAEASKQMQSRLPFTFIEDEITADYSRAFCKMMVDNLNSMPSWPPAYCERPRNPTFENLALLKWREWTAEEFDKRWQLLQQIEGYRNTSDVDVHRWTDIDKKRWREDIKNRERVVLETILPENTLAFGMPLKRLLRIGAESLEHVQRSRAALGFPPIPTHKLPEFACNLGQIIPLTADGASLNTDVVSLVPLGTSRWQLWLYEYSPGRYRLEEQHWSDVDLGFIKGVLSHSADTCRILYTTTQQAQGVN